MVTPGISQGSRLREQACSSCRKETRPHPPTAPGAVWGEEASAGFRRQALAREKKSIALTLCLPTAGIWHKKKATMPAIFNIMGGAKVDSLGGIGFFRLLLELLTTLDEYKIIGLKKSDHFLCVSSARQKNQYIAAESREL